MQRHSYIGQLGGWPHTATAKAHSNTAHHTHQYSFADVHPHSARGGFLLHLLLQQGQRARLHLGDEGILPRLQVLHAPPLQSNKSRAQSEAGSVPNKRGINSCCQCLTVLHTHSPTSHSCSSRRPSKDPTSTTLGFANNYQYLS